MAYGGVILQDFGVALAAKAPLSLQDHHLALVPPLVQLVRKVNSSRTCKRTCRCCGSGVLVLRRAVVKAAVVHTLNYRLSPEM